MYKVEISNNRGDKRTEYCYARNAKAAVNGYKELLLPEKYDYYKTTVFGYVKNHNGYFEPMANDEIVLIEKRGYASAGAYSNRRDTPSPAVPKDAVFMTKEEVEKELQ